MTLVELLVVVAILGLLAVAVLPAFSSGADDRAARQAAGLVTAQISRAQAAAIGKPMPVGIWIQPLDTSAAAVEMALARQPSTYQGDTFSATVSGSIASSGTFALTFDPSQVTLLITSMAQPFVSTGDLIQFAGVGPVFELVCPTIPLATSGTGWFARFRTNLGQTPYNTTWPVPAVPTSFAIQRKPVRAGTPATISSSMAIDLAWSGIGLTRFGQTTLLGDGQVPSGTTDPDPNDNLPSLPGYTPGQAIVVLFNAAGALCDLLTLNPSTSLTATQTRLSVREPLFLLVGRVDRCGLPYNSAPTEDSPGANWQYSDSYWISIDPRTGLVKTADTKLQVDNARASQAFIRSGLSVPGL